MFGKLGTVTTANADEIAPEPPWWKVPRRGEPRSALSRDAIIGAALRVLDHSGLDGLSMRRVAAELGTGAASLYWHVADKEQLLHLMLDRIMGEIELPAPDPTRWQEQLREYARASRAMFGRHGDIAIATLGRVPMGPNLVRIAEWLLALMRASGVPDRPATWFADLIALFGSAQAVEDHIAKSGDDPAIEEMGAYLSALPASAFPNLAAVAADMTSGSSDERFEFGLELLIRGLSTYVNQHE